ncbi:hypothetical protein PybrP1_007804 [[Pythium] brassicae (nom. inval.)]|nr:hypothetical protein PybrP1_007804 [[Pythium] brassicae (nom. inval.)]
MLAATALAFVTLLVFQLASVQHHVAVHAEKHHILRRLQQTSQSLRLRFKVKRDTMAVHGLSTFDVLANPVLSANADGSQSASFDGVAMFAIGDILHTYTLVDNVAYYTAETVDGASGAPTKTASCLPAGTLPPIDEILTAINSAKFVSAVNSEEKLACGSNSLYKLSFAGEQFVMCSESGNSLAGFKIYGADLDVDVSFLSSPITITAPALSDDAKLTCEKISSGAVVSTSTAKLLTGAGRDYVNHVLSRTNRLDSVMTLASSSCSCKGPKRPCLFFHGVDKKEEGAPQDSLDYFGDIHKHAPCCSSVKFAVLDTYNYGWDSDALQQKVCSLSLSMSNSSNIATKSIENTIIVAHSMGNLMLGGAIATGKCSLAKSSSWVAISGPMRGSMGSDLVQTVCAGGNLGADIVKAVVGLFGQCPASVARRSLSYEGERYMTPALQAKYDALQVVYKKFTSAAMCSNSFTGLLSLDQLPLILGGTIIPHKSSENDGVVEYGSCVADLDASKFADSYSSKFYKAKLNHRDTAFRHGDALFNNAQKPIKWFECLLKMWHSSRTLLLALATFAGVSAGASFRAESTQAMSVARQLSVAPALRLHVSLKRNTMFVFGQSEFDMFANPVVTSTSSVSFDGLATFTSSDGSVNKFVHVDGVTYAVTQSLTSETVSCLPATVMAPLLSLVDAINGATPVVNVLSADEQVKCASANLYKINFGGENYALCAEAQASGAGFRIVGADVDIEAFYLPESVSIAKPTLDAAVAASCERAVTTTSMTAATQALLTGTAAAPANSTGARVLTQSAEEATVAISASSCACKGVKRPCIFFEGLGSTTNTGLKDTTDYFDDISEHAPCCSSIKFADVNTVDFAWTSSIQQQKVCDLAISMSSTSSASTKTIANTIIVAHSMGNLLLAGAIANGKCNLASTTSWVALSGPMKGSMGSDYLQNACSGNSNGFVSAVANLIGRCPANLATVSIAYQGEAYSSSALSSAYTAAQSAYRTYVSAAMCSNANDGLLSLDQVVYKLGGSVINHKSKENDGIVEYASCAGGLATSKFTNTHTSKFYVTKLNHADTAFRHGDALFDNSQKPVKWFECLL